jgi:ABC-type spermidine/putrescine transport system permease subunit I
VNASIRSRLTVVYAVVLLGTCTVLLGLNYAMLYRSLYTNIRGPSPAEMATAAAEAGIDPQTDEKFQDFEHYQAKIAKMRAETLLNTAGASAILLAVTALLGLGVSWFIAGRMLRPLRSLTAATRRIFRTGCTSD